MRNTYFFYPFFAALLILNTGFLPYQDEDAQKNLSTPSQFSQSGDEDSPEKGDEDPWTKVDFGKRDLENIISIVDKSYYNKSYSRHLSWIEAASYALLFSVKNHSMELLPESYYEEEKARLAKAVPSPKKKEDPLAEYEEKMDGDTFKIAPTDKFIIRKIPVTGETKKKKKKLSDDDLHALDARDKAKYKRKKDAWEETKFDKADFLKVTQHLIKTFAGKMEPAKDKDGKDKKTKEAIFEEKKMWIYASSGYLVSLDPHSSIISKYAWDKSTQTLQDSSFDGIGAILIQKDDYTMIENPLEGQPAARAGLKAGDLIVKVNGVSTHKMLLQDVVKRIKGPKGTKVKLTIERPGAADTFVVSVERDRIVIKNVKSKLVSNQNKIGYIKLTGFIETSYESIVQHFRKLEQQAGGYGQLKGLIFDLRNNSGGLLEQAARIADLFIHRGKIVTVKYGNGREDVHRARSPDITRAPIIVLVNASSASASEILASAIQDQKRGLVLGERTFGKASVQQLIPNSALNHTYYTKITIARYYAPSGRTIQVIGVSPDVAVTPDLEGKFPYRFREENYAGHLSQLSTDYDLPNKTLVTSLEPCVKKVGSAEKTIKTHPNPQIKHDYQLLVAVDYMNCWINPNLMAEKNTSRAEELKSIR